MMKVYDMAIKEGNEFKIRVKPKDDAEAFSINIGHDEDNIALHFNPRFDLNGDSNVIVCNSKSGGEWMDEQREETFPFTRGEESTFYIKLPDDTMMHFPNRLGDTKYKYFMVKGGAK